MMFTCEFLSQIHKRLSIKCFIDKMQMVIQERELVVSRPCLRIICLLRDTFDVKQPILK